ncbi:MAG TPA: quinolinate synthase NadA, partial [Kribbella sp.]|nr:quinolinate synthase NadA [Kribbella sp.]
TEYIIQALEDAEPGTSWAVGTELNLVQRLAKQHTDKNIVFLDKTVCYCATMNRIDLPHFVWTLENLVAGHVVNPIKVDAGTEHYAKVALDQMLALPGKTAKD